MNRRLFVRRVAAGAALLGIPSSLLARSTASLSSIPVATSLHNVATWLRNGSIGSLQHVRLLHVYSPEHTSLSALKTMVQANLADINALLRTDFTFTERIWSELSSTDYGSFGTQLEQNGVTLNCEGLARIGSQQHESVFRLQLSGSQGVIQLSADKQNYELIDLSTHNVPQNLA